jgi:glycerol-3-phosphate cytidylyltransferase
MNINKKTIITYGTFDTFHYGHIEILNKSKKLGDFLIVGVSTDEFNETKGKKSLFPFLKRKEWVESLKCVDLVIPESNWGQKEKDIKEHNVNILTMGDDWVGKFDHLPCQVVYLKRTDGISSTQIKHLK